MVVLCLISLREGVMVRDASPVVAEASEVWFLFLLLLNGNSHDFHLVVSQTDLDLELVWHHELVSLDRVVVVGWLLSDLITFLAHHVLVVHRIDLLLGVSHLVSIHHDRLTIWANHGLHDGLSIHVNHVWVHLHHHLVLAGLRLHLIGIHHHLGLAIGARRHLDGLAVHVDHVGARSGLWRGCLLNWGSFALSCVTWSSIFWSCLNWSLCSGLLGWNFFGERLLSGCLSCGWLLGSCGLVWLVTHI